MNYKYYYNNVPEKGLCRNNLIYTSLIREDKKVFCQWYFNDGEYHKGQNEVVDPNKMNEKWIREITYLQYMEKHHPDLIPKILEIDLENKKIFLEINEEDFWEKAGCDFNNFDSVLPDWQDQMIEIILAHKKLGLYKYSMHPSSYFVIDKKLKSINYFFTYHKDEGPISIADHSSHIYSSRQEIVKEQIKKLGITWDDPQPLHILEILCWESFRNTYPCHFIDKVIKLLKQPTESMHLSKQQV